MHLNSNTVTGRLGLPPLAGLLIGLFVVGITSVASASAPIIERGSFTMGQANREQWHEVTFKQQFSKIPVVILGPASFRGGDPLTLIVKEVTKSGFKYQIREWEYLANGNHIKETFSYLAVEPGMHTVNGQLWEAGRRDFPNPGWKAISTQSPFSAPPIVLAQPIAETSTVARVKEVNAQGFKLSLQTEESLPNTDATPARCGWLVISKGVAEEAGLRSFAGSTGMQVNHLWKSVILSSPHGARAGIFANTQTFAGPDPVSIRYRNFEESGVDFRLQEEKSKDSELTHVKEEIGFLILSDIQPQPIETSRLEVAEAQTGKAWAAVDFQLEHRHPVVIPGLLGFNGSDPAIPRISQVTPQGFKIQVAEWDYLDQHHARENIPYLVLEEGVYSAGNGIWEAGRTFVDGKSWKKVRFRSDQFGTDPIVMVGQTTVKEPSKVTIRLRNVTQTGFEARLYRQESDKAVQHGRETIHFLAVDQAAGNLSNVADFKTWRKEDANNLWKGVALPTFADLPFVFGSTQTTQGIDPIGVRARNHAVSSFELKLQEESSADSERGHVHEVVAGLALGVFSLDDSDGDGLSDAEELYGQEVIYTVEVEVPLLDPVTGQETGATETITQTHMDWVYTDPNDDDSDGDGLPDGFEFDYGLNPLYSADGERDSDGDGISDGDEYVARTHELSWFTDSTDDGSGETGGDDTSGGSAGEDTSGGGSGDDGGTGAGDPPAELIRPPVDPLQAWMNRFGFDSNDTGVLTADTDGDSLSNEEEYEEGLNPLMADTDFDGYTDSEEIDAGSDPLDGTDYVSDLPVGDDGDRDGILDSWELLHGLDPTDERDAVRDFDYDRLPSIVEFQLGTNPVVGTQSTEINRVKGWKSELTLPSSGRLPNEATVTFNDLGEWFSLDENGQGKTIVKRWSEALGFEEIGELGDSNVRFLSSIAANNFSTVAAWVVNDLDDYELRVSFEGGDAEVLLSAPLTDFRPVGKLAITDAGFVVGAYEDADGDDYAFRWRSGVLEVVGIQSANKGILGVSEIGEVLTEFSGIVLPRGREDFSETKIYRSISKFGEIRSLTQSSGAPFGYVGSTLERSTDYFLNTLGDSFSFYDVRFHSGSDYSWLARPGRHASFTIEGERWKLDGRQAFDVSRDDHVLQSGGTSSSDYSESEDYIDWDNSYMGSFSDPYFFPEKDAALLALDFNEYRDVVGFIYYDAEDYYSDGSSASTEAGFHFQYPRRDYHLGDSRFWRINDAGEVISSATFEEYWEYTDDETGWYEQGHSLVTNYYLRSPDNDLNQNRLPDDWEAFWGINDPADDLDGDGLTAFQEYAFNTNPHLSDSDGDGVHDKVEIQIGLNPRSADAEALDSDLDGDGLPLWKELELGTNVHFSDTDQDGLSDREEWEIWGSNPLNEDHDGDGILDGDEVLNNTNPTGDDPVDPSNGEFEGDELFFWGISSELTDVDGSGQISVWPDRSGGSGQFLQTFLESKPDLNSSVVRFDRSDQLYGNDFLAGSSIDHVFAVLSVHDAWVRPGVTHDLMQIGRIKLGVADGKLTVSIGAERIDLVYVEDEEVLFVELKLDRSEDKFRLQINDYQEVDLDAYFSSVTAGSGIVLGGGAFSIHELLLFGEVLNSSKRSSLIADLSSDYTLSLPSVPPVFQGYLDGDGDNMPDWWEVEFGLDTSSDDSGYDPDGDGLSNLEEFEDGFNPSFFEDSDNDEMPDHWESRYGLEVGIDDSALDRDNDGISNLDEFLQRTNPSFDKDTDKDDMPDWWELQYPSLDPGVHDADLDGDGDFLTNLQEFRRDTDPTVFTDSDSDGLPDGWEERYHLDPDSPLDASEDADFDLVLNSEEYTFGTSPVIADTDGDGFPDWIEMQKGANPLSRDEVPAIDITVGSDASDIPTVQAALSMVSGEGQVIQVSEGAFAGSIDLSGVPHSVLVIGRGSQDSQLVGVHELPTITHGASGKTQFVSRVSVTHADGQLGLGLNVESTSTVIFLETEIHGNRGDAEAGASAVQALDSTIRFENSILAQNSRDEQSVISLQDSSLQFVYSTISESLGNRLRVAILSSNSRVEIQDSIIWQGEAPVFQISDAVADSEPTRIEINGLVTNNVGLLAGAELLSERVTVSDPWLTPRGYLTAKTVNEIEVISSDIRGDIHGELRREDFDLGADEFWDTDGDGLPDWYEDRHGLSMNDPSDGGAVSSSGVSYEEAYRLSLDPDAQSVGGSLDSDADGLFHNEEIIQDTNPEFPDHPLLRLEVIVETR